MADKKKPAAKTLAVLKNSAKGPIHHIEIHPAKNGHGQQAFITKVYRNHPKPVEDAAMKQGKYLPEPQPEQAVHEDGNDMLDHVAGAYGIPQDQGEPDGDEQEAA
jgi:hypothetical protein